jgi:GNAT superfamily N-acetyltransferase
MDGFVIRPATAVDLSGMHDIFYRNEIAGVESPPPPGPIPAWMRHTLDTGQLLVADDDGALIGYAGLTIRNHVAFLTDLFVRPDRQSRGIGGRLLRQIMTDDWRIRCTLASSDPRALALYIRAGMQPRWQNFWLFAEAAALRLSLGMVRVVGATPGEFDLINWDRSISGRSRPEDHRFWVGQQGGVPLWLYRGDHRLGYGYVRFADGPIWHPNAATIGPVGVGEENGAEGLLALVRWCRERASHIRLCVPGPHPALAPLLSVGFRITDVETFVSSGDRFCDPRRYLSAGGETF